MSRLASKRPDLIRAIDDDFYKATYTDAGRELSLSEEVVATMASRVSGLSRFDLAMAKHRRWLRDNIPGADDLLGLSDREIINEYVLPARTALFVAAQMARNQQVTQEGETQ